MTPTNRRSFLKHAALATASFTIVPRHVLGGMAFASPNAKINMGLGRAWEQ